MIRVHSWLPVLHDDHRPTNTSSVTGDMDSPVMMVEVDADELVHFPSSPKLAELCHESEWRTAHANDRTIDIDNVGVVAINLSTSCETNI